MARLPVFLLTKASITLILAVGTSKPSSYDQGSQSMPNPSDLDDEIPF